MSRYGRTSDGYTFRGIGKKDRIGTKEINFLELSKIMENLEKTSFLPRINGICSLAAKAHVTAIGLPMIFKTILLTRADTVSPPIPRNLIRRPRLRSMARSAANDAGTMEQSAPVSTRKSKFWYPYFVRRGMEIMGSASRPRAVRFFPNGYSSRIDTKVLLWGDVAERKGFSIQPLLADFADQAPIGVCTGEYCTAFAGNELTSITDLKFGIRNFRFHDKGSIA